MSLRSSVHKVVFEFEHEFILKVYNEIKRRIFNTYYWLFDYISSTKIQK